MESTRFLLAHIGYLNRLIFFKNYFHYYTDGSRKDEIASFGGFADQLDNSPDAPSKRIALGAFSDRICDYSSIFTAEAEGIMPALTHIKMSPKADGKFVIFSDSKSVLESVPKQQQRHPERA